MQITFLSDFNRFLYVMYKRTSVINNGYDDMLHFITNNEAESQFE
jgi:hypothetical protein